VNPSSLVRGELLDGFNKPKKKKKKKKNTYGGEGQLPMAYTAGTPAT